MPPRSVPARVVLFAALLLVLLVAPAVAHAGGAVVAPSGTPAPAVSVRMAVAVGPRGATRWTEVTLPPGSELGWLVPMRPGAVVEWAPREWLTALDVASAPRVVAPESPAPCELHQSFEMPSRWVQPAAAVSADAIAFPASAADAVAWAEGQGLSVTAAEGARLRDLYASGWRVAAVKLASSLTPRSSPVLRVTDDGGPILPLSIGASSEDTAVTLFVVGAGAAALENTRNINDGALRWGAHGSSYAALRAQLLEDGGWLRESSSHDSLFAELTVTSSQRISPVVTTYFEASACATEVQSLGSSAEVTDAALLTCGDRTDLALALAGIAPVDAVLTRLAGVLPAGAAAGTPAITFTPGVTRSPVRRTTSYDFPCTVKPVGDDDDDDDDDWGSSSGATAGSSSSGGFPRPSPTKQGSSTYGSSSYGSTVYVPSDGCSGSTTTTVGDDDDDDDTSDGWDSSDSSDGWDSSDSGDGCGGDTSTGGDGWDSSDSGDGCGGDTSTGDGWDSSDSSCTTTRSKRRRGPSPLSRVVMLVVAMLLPLRRFSSRTRPGERPDPTSGECS